MHLTLYWFMNCSSLIITIPNHKYNTITIAAIVLGS